MPARRLASSTLSPFGMSDREVRDASLAVFFAGHETTACLLSWTWYVLANRQDIQNRVLNGNAHLTVMPARHQDEGESAGVPAPGPQRDRPESGRDLRIGANGRPARIREPGGIALCHRLDLACPLEHAEQGHGRP